MDFLDDPAKMSPSERLSEVAAILAAGYLRLRRRPELAVGAESRLDCRGEPRPPLDAGSEAEDPVEEEEVAG